MTENDDPHLILSKVILDSNLTLNKSSWGVVDMPQKKKLEEEEDLDEDLEDE